MYRINICIVFNFKKVTHTHAHTHTQTYTRTHTHTYIYNNYILNLRDCKTFPISRENFNSFNASFLLVVLTLKKRKADTDIPKLVRFFDPD